MRLTTGLVLGSVALAFAQCPDYDTYAKSKHQPYSSGAYQLSQMRPDASCRTATDPRVEAVITKLGSTIKDPDLYRLFVNSFPNTLDTTVKWTGSAANNSNEELAFVITGDITAMWLRDSANQMQSYVTLLSNASQYGESTSSGNVGHYPASNTTNETVTLEQLYRGVINLQARFVNTSPYCNSFQPPVESGLDPTTNGVGDQVKPSYDPNRVFECKFELDSLAAFLELSHNYFTATNDVTFFGKFQWVAAVQTILNVAEAMMTPTYAPNGTVNSSPYTFQRSSTAGTETLANSGIGNPVQAGIGLVRSAFRPSDDATIYQYFIPANMMFSQYLGSCAAIASGIGQNDLAQKMTDLSNSIKAAIYKHGLVDDPDHGSIWAYEIDGFGGRNMMDDANIPSLLSAPVYGFLSADSKLYDATRRKLLSADNPYFMRGPVINAIGGPHDGPGRAWPMASIVRILTSADETEVYTTLKEIVSSTNGLGLIHESIQTFDQSAYTREWFAWANGLFGQMIIDLSTRMPQVLQRSYQP